jgi:predicted nuclease with TOPRIM domain
MKKADEIYLLDSLIQQTPKNSYLRTMLDHMRVQFESDIRSDFSTLPDFAEIEREAVALRTRQAELVKLNETVAQQIRDMRSRQAMMHNRLRQLSLEAKDIETAANRMADTIAKDAT